MGEYFIIFIRCKGEYYLQFSTSLESKPKYFLLVYNQFFSLMFHT